MQAQFAHQALPDYANHIARKNVRQDANVEQTRNRANCGVGVQRGIDLVPGHRGTKGHFRRVGIANLADQNHVRILTHERADAAGKI